MEQSPLFPHFREASRSVEALFYQLDPVGNLPVEGSRRALEVLDRVVMQLDAMQTDIRQMKNEMHQGLDRIQTTLDDQSRENAAR